VESSYFTFNMLGAWKENVNCVDFIGHLHAMPVNLISSCLRVCT
jgi:hypothetical protein